MSYNVSGCVLIEKPSIDIEPTRFYDASRFKNHGTHTNVTMVRRPSGLWERSFAGDGYVQIGDTSSFKFLHGALNTTGFQLTIKFWMSLPTPEPNAIYTLVSTSLRTSAQSGCHFSFDDRSSQGFSRKLALFIGREVAGQTVIDTRTSDNVYPNDTNPHHIVVTYDQSLANSNATFYVDAVNVGTGSKTGNTPSTSNSEDELHIGSSGSEAEFLTGRIGLPEILDFSQSPGWVKKSFESERHWFGV